MSGAASVAAPRSPAAFRPRRIPVALSCQVCANRNYKTSKLSQDGVPALKFSKFCKHCNRHTVHIEGR